MTDRIEANYDMLGEIANKFADLHDRAEAMRQSLDNAYGELESTWTGAGFDAFDRNYQDSDHMPATKRLVEALQYASAVTKQIANLFKDADEECSGGFHIQ